MRKTHALVSVVAALMDDPSGKHWGYDTSKKTGVRPGVLYPILSRLLDAGWLTDGWEPTSKVKGRPARRYYTVTKVGRDQLQAILNEASRDPRFSALDLKTDEKVTKG